MFLLDVVVVLAMSGKDRIAIFPSRGAQTLMKARLKGAQKGHRSVVHNTKSIYS